MAEYLAVGDRVRVISKQPGWGGASGVRIMDTIIDLKTKTNVTTTRENATNSWMPHDEDGCL